jgi:hypothetical protein
MYLENRLIAMVDVLGFASRIETRQGMEITTAKYAELIARARAHMFAPKGTILLMETFFSDKFPLRGSIGIGDFCKDEAAEVFLSNAFKRLRIDEENQQWTGCVLLHEAEEIVVSSLLGSTIPESLPRSSPLHYLSIPTKQSTAEPQQRWCLNWSHFLASSMIEVGLKQMSGDRDKQRNTREYLQVMSQLTDDTQVLTAEFSPAKRMKVMKARSGLRIKFEEDDGHGVNPGCSYTIAGYEADAQPGAAGNAHEAARS